MIHDPHLSSAARALMQAARGEGPTAAAQAKIWGGVTTAAATAVAGAAGPATIVTAGGTGKLVAAGALLGSAVTVGLAMVMMHVGPSPAPHGGHATPAALIAGQPPRAAAEWERSAPPFVPSAAAMPSSLPAPEAARVPDVAAPATRLPLAPRAADAPIVEVREDALLLESRLVAEAQGALVRGDAPAALRAIRVTQRLGSRVLEPEELSIESRALRALGREDEAMSVDLQLRARFPEHALAR